MSWRYLLRVYAVCLGAIPSAIGALEGMRMVLALKNFGAETRLGGVLAVSIIHRCPAMATLCACIALVMHLHRGRPDQAPDARASWVVTCTLPVAAAAAAVIATAAGVLVGRTMAPFGAAWESMKQFVAPSDFLSALGRSSAAAMVLAPLATPMLRQLAKRPGWHVAAKIGLAWLVSSLLTGLVDASWRAAFGPVEQSETQSE